MHSLTTTTFASGTNAKRPRFVEPSAGGSPPPLLPVIDDLERALAHADDDSEIVRGLAVVLDEAYLVLARLGYPRYEDLGEVFDPQRDEAVGAVDADAPAGTVVATVRPGYGKDGDILRPAGVMVARTRAG